MGTRTGTPGFDIDGKSYTYDVGDPNAPDDPKYPIATDPGDVQVDDSVKDISKKTKKTLADYLGKKTAKNYYPVDGSAADPETKIAGEDGKNQTPTIPAADKPTSNSTFFTKGKKEISGTTVAAPSLKHWMTRGDEGDNAYVPPDPALAKVNKGKSAGDTKDGKDGNHLLPEVEGGAPGLPDPINKYTTSVLHNNRFTADNISANVDIQNPGGYNPALYSPKFGRFTTRRLAQVGISLSIRASRELNSAQSDQNPSSGGTEAKALLPSFNQLGAERVDAVILEAQDVLRNLSTDEVPEGQLINFGTLSWGSLNNALDPYSGITALGMIALSAALTAGITLVFEGLGFLLSLVKGSPEPRHHPDGRFILGRSTVTKQADPNAFPPGFPPDIGALLGLHSTIKPFSDCLKKGVLAFFGIDDSSVGGAILSGLSSAASAPGYNSVVARSIIRSLVVIIDSIKKIFASSNFMTGIKNLLSMIDTLRTSKLISAINIFTTLGDAILVDNPDDLVKGRPEEPMRKSKIDKLPDEIPRNRAIKSRTGDGTTLKLAWASNRSPSLYLLPNATAGLQPVAGDLGAFQSGLGLQEAATRSFYRIIKDDDTQKYGNRIPVGDGGDPDDAVTLRNMERMLDAEYIPFYFHDVRTNEIVSFHAFLASLTDDYTANYEASEGFGRVEPVKIYKGTTRKIGLSFYVAATSAADFNDMWVKINKMVTLVYPQYTQGRTLFSPDSKYKFSQPFSQMMGASPLIRIRLGNLLRSNYSRFNLARLFGATIKDAQFGNAPLSLDGSKLATLNDKLNEAKKTAGGDKKWLLMPGSYDTLEKAAGISFGGGDDAKPTGWKAGPEAAYIPIEITDAGESDSLVVKPSMPDADFLTSQGVAVKLHKAIIDDLTKRFDNSDDPKNKIMGVTFCCKPDNLMPTNGTAKKIFNETFASENAAVADLMAFLDIEKNAIVKSFKSAGGKGLAGFIDSMSFDWYDKAMWDAEGLDRQAPMMCKITISFSPIHDITPGLDSQGYNRAPVYPVGFFAQATDADKKG